MVKLLSSVSVVALLALSPAVAQTSTSTPPQEKSATQDQSAAMTMTEDQAKAWVDKVVYSSDGKNIGEVAEFKRSTDNKVSELHADIGGFLGVGETRIKLMPSEFTLQGDSVVLNITEEQVNALPKAEK
jgi:maltose-binding protein MalE